MNESYCSLLATGVEKRMRDLEISIMEDIIRRIKKAGTITETADWQIQRLLILGNSTEDIRALVSRAVDGNEEMVRQLYEEVIEREYTGMRELYEASGKEFMPFEHNHELRQLTDALIAQGTEELYNITKSTGFMIDMGNGRKVFTPLSDIYNKHLDNAITGMVSGAYDYNTLVRRMVNQMTASGLRTDHQFKDGGSDYGIDYASGHHNRIDVAARRALLTGFGQLTGQIIDRNAQSLNTAFYEVTWHAGARPSHAAWQGKVFSREQLKTVCGLGSGAGLLGWNCRHTYYPFIPGVSQRQYTDEWLEQKAKEEAKPKSFRGSTYNACEATQRQRQLETLLRARREQVLLLRQSGADPETITEYQCRYQAALLEYREFSRTMGLPTQTERIYSGRTPGRSSPSPQKFAQWQAEKEAQADIKARERAEKQRRQDMNAANVTQNYLPVTRGTSGSFAYSSSVSVVADRIVSYSSEVYVANNVKIKPLELHRMNRYTEEAMQKYGVPLERKPTIVVANAEDILSYGKYDAVTNTVYYANDIANKKAMESNGGIGSTEAHEMWHLKQAENYRNKGHVISADNYSDYLADARIAAKANLDKWGINEYNVHELSDYAVKKWIVGHFDEVEAEYMRINVRRGRK